MSSTKLVENVPRAEITHPKPTTIQNGIDVSANNRSWKSYLWDTFDKSPAERRLLFKVDATLVTFGCLGTFIKFLDRANLNTAFVSGMKEELHLYGNQLNYANTSYSIASIIALVPVNLLLTRTNPRYFIPFLEIGWTVCTFGQSRMNTAAQLYALRALLAIFETGHYSAIMYLCGSWYQKGELARRMAIVNMAAQAGPMFSAYLQAAAYSGLNGKNGLAGWRWLFIIDGIISLGIIIPQLFLLPEVPSRLKPNFMFSAAEIELARDRQTKEGRVRQGAFSRAQVLRWFTTPEIWILWLIAASQNIGYLPNQSMAFWFKAWNKIKPNSYTVQQINNYTTPIYATTITITTLMAWASDTVFKGRRWPMLILGGAVNFVVCILLATTPVFPEHKAFRWFLYYQTGWGEASNCMFWAWTNEILSGDPATRAFAGAGLQVWSQVFAATIPLAVFQTVDQPRVKAGNFTAAGFWIVEIICASALAYMLKYKNGKGTQLRQNVPVEGSQSESIEDLQGKSGVQPHIIAV
ncbi:Pantothenate transporter [Lachnellula occidentalis]|uniref:Pantothenate transporter n=1 Tax=Lachnellula occidentalis TaxID=215460 RepID=A0A8H8RJM7_9HELO|nr:Pantothenate transporter [Lachnellula occidentalis]